MIRRKLFISQRAEADLREIWRWTYANFGEQQADCYLDELEAGMRECAAAPESGKDRESLRQGYRSRRIRKHVVFYTWSTDQVLVQRVLHSSMDFESHLLEEA